ncbi:hypothetical protein [Streptomyces sp. NPDC048623]|uniref:hypothetical protein n=1 Tax=Streptomyces sp. NPDC048623 TaxID=3155761 RepID=UPI003446092D
MNLRRTTAAIGGALATATALTALTAAPAFAGTNGQQIAFNDRQGTVYSVQISGQNQNGDWTVHCFNTPSTNNYLSGWWWKGTTHIVANTDGNCGADGGVEKANFYTDVPFSQSGDWWWVSD